MVDLLAGARPGSTQFPRRLDKLTNILRRFESVRTNHVDIKAQVYWAVPDSIANAFDNLWDTKVVDIVCRDQFEADRLVVFEVYQSLCYDNPVSCPYPTYNGEEWVKHTASLHRIPACTLELRISFSS